MNDAMAKDDFHVIAYRILTYLYQCLKSGKNVDPKQIGVDSDYFKVNGQTIMNAAGVHYPAQCRMERAKSAAAVMQHG